MTGVAFFKTCICRKHYLNWYNSTVTHTIWSIPSLSQGMTPCDLRILPKEISVITGRGGLLIALNFSSVYAGYTEYPYIFVYVLLRTIIIFYLECIFLFIHEKALESFAHSSASPYNCIPTHLFDATFEIRKNP